MAPFPYGETATRLRRLTWTDPYSAETSPRPWNDPGHVPSSLAIDGCGFDPGGSSEPVETGRHAVITKPTAYLPFDADVLAGDRLVIRGRTWDVDGDPADWLHPMTGWTAGTVVELKAVSG